MILKERTGQLAPSPQVAVPILHREKVSGWRCLLAPQPGSAAWTLSTPC